MSVLLATVRQDVLTSDSHEWRIRDGARPLHLASCPCWRGTSFTMLRQPRSSLWDYLASPRRSRGRSFPW